MQYLAPSIRHVGLHFKAYHITRGNMCKMFKAHHITKPHMSTLFKNYFKIMVFTCKIRSLLKNTSLLLARFHSSLPAQYTDRVDLKDGLLKKRVCTVKFQ